MVNIFGWFSTKSCFPWLSSRDFTQFPMTTQHILETTTATPTAGSQKPTMNEDVYLLLKNGDFPASHVSFFLGVTTS